LLEEATSISLKIIRRVRLLLSQVAVVRIEQAAVGQAAIVFDVVPDQREVLKENAYLLGQGLNVVSRRSAEATKPIAVRRRPVVVARPVVGSSPLVGILARDAADGLESVVVRIGAAEYLLLRSSSLE